MSAPPRARRRAGSRPLEERAFHAWLARTLGARGGLLPVGDDAAALTGVHGKCLVASVDTLVEGTHFLAATDPGRIGRAAVAVGLSDLASKGARPEGVLLAVVLPPGTPERWARSLASSAESFAARYGAHVLGGDTKSGRTPTVVCTVLGWADPQHLAPRTQGRPGDLLVTTGTVGRGGVASAGLAGSTSHRRRAVDRLLAIAPRVAEGRALARWAHAMLDTSDGLADSARILAAASGLRVEVDEWAVPWAASLLRRSRRERLRAGFYGGDYELLAAGPSGGLARVRAAVRASGGKLTVIGRLRAGVGAWLVGRDGPVRMPAAGWKSFGGTAPAPDRDEP